MQCQAHCELQEAFIDYIEYKDDKVVTPMPRSMKEFFIRSCPAPSFHPPTLKLPKLRILPQVPGCFRILTGFRVQVQKTWVGRGILGLERCSLQEPNSHASTIRELMQEVEENYVLSMKLWPSCTGKKPFSALIRMA